MNTASTSYKKPVVIVLFGPTAAGKSEILYNLLNSKYEIISADSMQVYKYLNIGTAKPTEEQLAQIHHYLINLTLPSYQFNAADFVHHTEKYLKIIMAKKKIPVISGGTAFYLKSFLFGLPAVPGRSDEIRAELEKEADETGCRQLYTRLQEIDPCYAEIISVNDRRRIIRALEVYGITGKPLSAFKQAEKIRTDYDFLLIGLERPRQELYHRINLRVDRMFRDGLVEEIRGLLKMGYTDKDPGMRGIGYREFFTMQKLSLTLKQVQELIKRNSRHYAKRQMTFFRAFPGVRWFQAGDIEGIRECIEGVVQSDKAFG